MTLTVFRRHFRNHYRSFESSRIVNTDTHIMKFPVIYHNNSNSNNFNTYEANNVSRAESETPAVARWVERVKGKRN